MTDEPITHTCPDGKTRPGTKWSPKRCAVCFRAYQRARTDKKQAERAKVGPTGFVVFQKRKGRAIKHGFYRRTLTELEAEEAEKMHKELLEEFNLDSSVDDMMLYLAVSNFIKALRDHPNLPATKTIGDMRSFYERQFREAMDALALTRKQRKDGGEKPDQMADALKAMFKPKEGAQEPKVPDDLKPSR